MRLRALLPLSLRLRILRWLRPAREVRLHAEALRGLYVGERISPNGNGGASTTATARAPNRLERFFDTHTVGPGIEKWRHYFEIYDRHFAKFVGGEVYVVEIGVSSGGSLQMWRDYFGPGCHVYGIDIDPNCRTHENEYTRICIGDQGDPRFWTWFLRQVPRIDILIDDGSHRVHEQRVTFESVFSHIAPGGVYLCEDIHDVDHPFLGYVSGLARNLHSWDGCSTTQFQQAVQSIHLYPFVTVIERPQNALMELPAQRRGTEWRQVT